MGETEALFSCFSFSNIYYQECLRRNAVASVVCQLVSDIPGGGWHSLPWKSVLENVIKGPRAPDVSNIIWK